MRSKWLFLIVLIAVLAALPGTVQANLVFNPGFEDQNSDNTPWVEDLDPDEWGGWNPGGSRAWIETGGVSGAGLDLTTTAATGMWAWPVGTGATSDIPIDPAKDYFFAVKAKGGSSIDFKIEWHAIDGETGAGALPNVVSTHATTSDWTQIQVGPLTSDPAANFVRFAVINYTTGTTVTIDDAWVDTYLPVGASGVHSPSPQDGGTVVPGTDTVAWTRYKGRQGDDLRCTLYWSGGASDVNDVNFDVKVPSPVATFVDQDANSVYLPDHGLSIVVDKNYYWRVDCEDPNGNNWGAETLVGPVWTFTTINAAPVVDAGQKQNAWLPDGGGTVVVPLTGAVTDDILPVGGSLDPYWEKLSGTGTAVFSDPCILDPTVTIGTADDYELKLTVNDGALPGSDTVVIRVFDFADESLEARYDCEETNATPGIHDDYSGYDRNPSPPAPAEVNPPTRRGERYDEILTPGLTGTTMVLDGGHNGAIYPGDVDTTVGDGGIQFDGIAGHIYVLNSDSDPNTSPWYPYADDPDSDPCWTRSWADLQDEVSLMAWIKVDTDNGGWDDAWESIISKGNAEGYRSYRLERNGTGGGVSFACGPGTAYGGFPVNDKDPNGNSRWHHVAGTYDGTEVCVYVDGLVDSCVEAEGQMPLADAPVTIGEAYGGPSDPAPETGGNVPFGGVMDEIRIHSVGVPRINAQAGAVSIVQIYRDSDGHTNCGGVYLPGDVNEDCYVNILDVKAMAEIWVECNDIGNEDCIP